MGLAQSSIGDADDVVQGLISQTNIVFFKKVGCGYCSRAMGILSGYVPTNLIQQIDLSDTNHNVCFENTCVSAEEVQDALQRITGQRTVPKLFVNGKSIGGCSEIEKLQTSGELGNVLAV